MKDMHTPTLMKIVQGTQSLTGTTAFILAYGLKKPIKDWAYGTKKPAEYLS